MLRETLRGPIVGGGSSPCSPPLSPPLGTTPRQHRLLPGAPLLRQHCSHANSAPPCARGCTATPSTPSTPTRHLSRRSLHGYLDHSYTPYTLSTITACSHAPQGYHPFEQLVDFL